MKRNAVILSIFNDLVLKMSPTLRKYSSLMSRRREIERERQREWEVDREVKLQRLLKLIWNTFVSIKQRNAPVYFRLNLKQKHSDARKVEGVNVLLLPVSTLRTSFSRRLIPHTTSVKENLIISSPRRPGTISPTDPGGLQPASFQTSLVWPI